MSNLMYFSINIENEMNLHATAKAAEESAQKELDSCRGPDGWEIDEDEILTIRWGQILGLVKHLPVDEPDHWNFELKSIVLADEPKDMKGNE